MVYVVVLLSFCLPVVEWVFSLSSSQLTFFWEKKELGVESDIRAKKNINVLAPLSGNVVSGGAAAICK